MEDEHPGIPYLCGTEHPGAAEAGRQARKGSGSDSQDLEAGFSCSLCSFFKRPQAIPSYLHRTTGYLSCLICETWGTQLGNSPYTFDRVGFHPIFRKFWLLFSEANPC